MMKKQGKTSVIRQKESSDIVLAETELGKIEISEQGISNIVRTATCSVPGVARLTGSSFVNSLAELVGSKAIRDRSIRLIRNKDSFEVEVSINISYGYNLPQVASAVQRVVAESICEFTGLRVSSVNVTVRELDDPEEVQNTEVSQEDGDID